MSKVIERCLLLVCLLTATTNVFSARDCGTGTPIGKCYKTISSGDFFSYGEYFSQSRETVRASYTEQDGFELTRNTYRRSGTIFKYDGSVIQTKNNVLVLEKPGSFRSDVGVISLPQGQVSSCKAQGWCFTFERTRKDLYYGSKYRSSSAAIRAGRGLLLTNEGTLYVGEFRANKPHGEGHLIFFNGEEYIGDFKNGKFWGQGAFWYDSGKKYAGQWRDNLQEGQGSVFNSSGDLEWSGIWSAGKKISVNQIATAPRITPQAKHRVMTLQRDLISLGFLKGDPDGVPGPATKAAMRAVIQELPTIHHSRLTSLTWTDVTELEMAIETLRAYIAEPMGPCPMNAYSYSICFNGKN